MIEPIELKIDGITPLPEEVLLLQGIPKDAVVKDRINYLIEEAIDYFLAEAAPACIIKEISKNDFAYVFEGEGKNDDEAPLKDIYPQAYHISLFALTIGSGISKRITELFNKNDFPLGSMLDAVASISADKSVEMLEKHITFKLIEKQSVKQNSMVLSYSPGYCGWHISSQIKLFRLLHPEKIGISLNESCLMEPLKSVTGALLCCDKEVHNFIKGFSFCRNCKPQSCVERNKKILNN